MLETLWYLLVLAMQILQVDPQLSADKLRVSVYVASQPAYSFSVQGNAVNGQFTDLAARAVFGEFESTRRLPQAYVVFPRAALPPELEEAAKAGADKGGDKSAGKAGTAAKPGAKKDEKKELAPFTIDFTKALKALASFKAKPHQLLEFTEKERFLGGADGAAGTEAKPAASAAPAPKAGPAAAATGTAALPGAKAADKEKEKDMIDIRYQAKRLVVSAGFAQTLIIVDFD